MQLLYSYLLVQQPFSLESQPSAPTKEKRFAYNLYLNFIYLIDRIANQVKGKNRTFPLADSRFVVATEKDEKIKSLKQQSSSIQYPFLAVESELAEKIRESLLFKKWEKDNSEGKASDNFWENVFNAVILTDEKVNSLIKELPGYSLSGVDRTRELMNVTFKNFYSSHENIDDALKNLQMSLQKARDLYMRLLALPVELSKLHLERLESRRNKYLASVEDLNPDMKLADNGVARILEQNSEFEEYINQHHLFWRSEDPELLEILLKAVLSSEIYEDYLKDKEKGLHQDVEFWHNIFTNVILNNQDFLEYLENKSVFWNDDLEIMCSFVLKTLKRIDNPETMSSAVLPMYKDGENGKDAKFGAELFRYVVNNKEIYKRYIEDALEKDKWEANRLAFMDVVITMAALAEIINYPEIPLSVSINEYIEIAKSYSSAKSGQFIHGLLASLVEHLHQLGLTNK